MKITVTNFTLKDHFSPVNQPPMLEFIHPALKEFSRLKLPVPIASKMTKNIMKVEDAISEYEKTRINIVESLCERGEDEKPIIEGNKYKFSDDAAKEFNEKWNELLNTEITLDIKVIDESEIEKFEINGTCYQTLVKHGFIKEKVEPSEIPQGGKGATEKIKQNGRASEKELHPAPHQG